MLYLDDRLPTHPKILKAGARLGEGGASQALHLYILGITYARQHLTDGFIPDAFVLSCGVVSKSGSVAKVLANRTIRLWRKVHGGYQIHDYHKWNPKASTVKEKRELDRQRKAADRAGRKPNLSIVDTSRTRARASHESMKPVQEDQERTSTDAPRRLALAREKTQDPEPPTFALATIVMREALEQSWQADHDKTLTNVGEYFKTLCARRRLAYDADLVRRAYDAVMMLYPRRYA